MKTYIIEYYIKDNRGKGIAVVTANNPNRAYLKLKYEGKFNSSPVDYKVYNIQELNTENTETLLVESNLYYYNKDV